MEINNQINNNTKNYSFKRYTKAINTCLQSIGDTSYLNSVLYILANIRHFASYFLNPKNDNFIQQRLQEQRPLLYTFQRLLFHLYPFPETDKKEIYKPNALFQLLGNMNAVYKSFQKRNPNDLLCYLLNNLHNEMNTAGNNQKLEGNIYDRQNIIKTGSKNFQKNNNSIISNTLDWFEIKECLCNKCMNTSYEFQNYSTLSLDIKSAYNKKNNNNEIKESITINDSLVHYCSQKQKNLYCKNCKQSLGFLITTKIFSTSCYLFFLIDRGNDFDSSNELININLHINDKIDLSGFIENQISPKKFELIGIISIYLEQKKYVSFCLSPVDKKWYFYNDENIKLIEINEVLKQHNDSKEMIPCTLLYKTIDNIPI